MRGFIFSIDALIALGIAWLLLSAISQIPSAPYGSELRWQRQAADLTVLSDKQNVLENLASANSSAAQPTLNAFLESVLDSDLSARMEVQVFEPSNNECSSDCRLDGSSPIHGSCLCAWYNSSQSRPMSAASVFRRMAYVSGPPEKIVLVRAWVWK